MEPGDGGGGFATILPLVIIVGGFYFFYFRPKIKKQRLLEEESREQARREADRLASIERRLEKLEVALRTKLARAREEIYRNSPEGKREALFKALTDISGVSDKLARTLLDQYPTEESIQAATIGHLTNIPGVGESVATAIKARIG